MPVYVWENVDMLPCLSYTPTGFMSLVWVHSLHALPWVILGSMGYISSRVDPKQEGDATTQKKEEEKKFNVTSAAQDKCHISPWRQCVFTG